MAVGIARGIVFLHNTQLHMGLGKAAYLWPEDVFGVDDESLLERHKILLDEVKLELFFSVQVGIGHSVLFITTMPFSQLHF